MGETVTVNGVDVAVDDAGADGKVQVVKVASPVDGSAAFVELSTAAKQDAQTTQLTNIAAAVATTDVAAGASDPGIPPMLVRDDALTELGVAEGDYSGGRSNSRGAQWVALDTTLDATNDAVAVGVRSGIDGCDVSKNLDVDETEDAVKATAGTLYGFFVANLHASAKRYLKVYDATVANVTVGTTAPVLTFPLPADAAGWLPFPWPVDFANAITIAATTGLADSDTGAPGANEVVVMTFYK